MINTTKLPDTLHELLAVGLKDFEACEKDPNYIISMQTWHCPDSEDEVCLVCLAGSVMAKTCKSGRDEPNIPSDFSDGHKLAALDFLRRGRVEVAVFTFYDKDIFTDDSFRAKIVGLDLDKGLRYSSYYADKETWKKTMHRIYNRLKEHNL